MNAATALDWFRQLLWSAVLIAGPAVLVVVIVGLLIAIIQAATQVNDQAVAFGPKAIAVILTLAIAGGWMMRKAASFTTSAMQAIGQVHGRDR